MNKHKKYLVVALIILAVIIGLSCAPGNYRWDKTYEFFKPANFWAGFWHGLIIVITFIVSLFTNTVKIYEANNCGWAYNLGFIIGACISLGGGIRGTIKRKRHKVDWNEIEDKIREGVKSWVNETEDEAKKKEWEEIGKKVEEKIKRKLKEWADKE
jgi:hypothetical protein